MFINSSLMFLGLTLLLINITTAKSGGVLSVTKAQEFLSRYGYLRDSVRSATNTGLTDENAWIRALKDFQNFFGLNTTGELDKETIELMSKPRCGVEDKRGVNNPQRSNRYVLQGSRWNTKFLTYKILNYPSTRNMSNAEVDAEIARAFAVWSNYTDLTFTRKTAGVVDIDIKFTAGSHGCKKAFDGSGGTLAHAYFPIYEGDAHFDDAEEWTINDYQGINLFQVAAHEFGHSLGLQHSNVTSALMAPYYHSYQPNFKLDADDIAAIQALYGNKSAHALVPPQRPKNNSLCTNPKIDAILTSTDGETYIFQGNFYYKLNETTVADGYPKLISETWPGLPGNIDAAFTLSNGYMFFFKGTKYWRYNRSYLDSAFPRLIRIDFKGIPKNLDAALYRRSENKVYFFRGSKYWIYDMRTGSSEDAFVFWEGLPNDIDAAFEDRNGNAFVFKDDQYYGLTNTFVSVEWDTYPNYPRPTSRRWFGC